MKQRAERAEIFLNDQKMINVSTRNETASGSIGKFFGTIKLTNFWTRSETERAENIFGKIKLINVSTRSETASG